MPRFEFSMISKEVSRYKVYIDADNEEEAWKEVEEADLDYENNTIFDGIVSFEEVIEDLTAINGIPINKE